MIVKNIYKFCKRTLNNNLNQYIKYLKITSHRFSDDDAVIEATATKQLESLKPRVVRPSIVCMLCVVFLIKSFGCTKGLFLVTDAGSAFPPDNLVIKLDSQSMEECKQRLVTLKDFANDTNLVKVAASIDFEEVKRNIDNNKYFIALEEEPKTYDIVGFKVILVQYTSSHNVKYLF